MTEKDKSQNCCEELTATLRCEGDTLVVRLQGKDVERVSKCCGDDKDKGCC